MKNLANKITSFFKQTIFAKRGKHTKFHLPLQAYLSYLLFACILLTGYSFASYATSSGPHSDNAQVADYGVSIIVDTDNMDNSKVADAVASNVYYDYRFRGEFNNLGSEENTSAWLTYERNTVLQEKTADGLMHFKVLNNSEVSVFCKTFKFTVEGTTFPEETKFLFCGNEPTSTATVGGNTVFTYETASLVDSNDVSLTTPIDPRTNSIQYNFCIDVPLYYGESLQPGYSNVYFRARLLDDVTIRLLDVEVETQQYIPNP